MTSPSNGSTAVVGQPITFDVGASVNAPGSGTPMGTVTVTDGTQTCPAALSGGIGSCQITEPAIGNYFFTASYGGDSNDIASGPTNPAVEVIVGQDATTAVVTSATSNPVVGQPISVGVSVTASLPGGGTPTGTVTVSDGTQTCPATLSGGTGSCSITESAAGHYTFTATYGGDTNYLSSAPSNGFGVTVGENATTTDITSTTPSPVVGQPISVGVSVAVNPPGSGTPTGSATVSDGTRDCTVSALSGGAGSCSIAEPAVGGYTFTATYNGDSNDDSDTSSGTSVTVSKATSTTRLTLSGSSATFGDEQAEHLSVTVSPEYAGTSPTGSVTVKESSTTLCQITLVSAAGSCTLSPAQLGAGAYDLVASYGGDSNFDTSASGEGGFTVSPATSTTTLALSPTKVTYGDEQLEHVSFTVSPEYAGSTPTGTVTLKESSTTLCVITLASGKGSCTLSATKLGAGRYDVEATYGGDANFGTSASAKVHLTIAKATSRTALTLFKSRAIFGHEQVDRLSVTVSPQYAGSTPTGKVTLKESKTTLCVINLSKKHWCTLSAARFGPATYLLVASYAGDSNFDASASGKVSLSVEKENSRISLRLSTSKVTHGKEHVEQASVVVSPEFTGPKPTGTVMLMESKTTLCKFKLSSGKGACRLSAAQLAGGKYHLVAVYGGNSDLNGSVSASVTLTVSEGGSKTSLALSTSQISYGNEQVEHISVSVSAVGAVPAPTGTVKVKESTTTLCVIKLSSGKGSCTLSSQQLAAGTYHLVAVYSGNLTGSTSATETLTVAVARL